MAKQVQKMLHSPTLNTVLMVEEVLGQMDESVISVAALKKKLPKQVNHNTLMIILDYLERSNKIFASLRGISWIHNENLKLRREMQMGREL